MTSRDHSPSDLSQEDSAWRTEARRRAWGSTKVARKGELVDAELLPGLVALSGESRVGLLTFAVRADEVEVVTLHAEEPGRGVGRALMDALLEHARQVGARRIWLTTTNDNTRAICLYRQWGMDLAALSRDGVTASRRVKPSIPLTGCHGIPVRHELELELWLDAGQEVARPTGVWEAGGSLDS